MTNLFLVVETLEKTCSSPLHLPSGIKRNVLGIYDSFERAYLRLRVISMLLRLKIMRVAYLVLKL